MTDDSEKKFRYSCQKDQPECAMPSFIYRYSNLTIMAFFVTVITLAMDGIPWLLQLIPPLQPTELTNVFGRFLISPVGASAGLIIGFLLNQAQANFREVENAVAAEAGHINNLDRLLLRFGDDMALAIRLQLQSYINSIIHEEWHDLSVGRGNENTHMLWRGISQNVFKLDPQTPKQLAIYSDIIKKSEQVAESREFRVDRSTYRLPDLFWMVILLLLGSLTAINTLFFQSGLIFAYSILPIVFGGMISLLVITDQPFKGEASVKPRALHKALESIQTRSR